MVRRNLRLVFSPLRSMLMQCPTAVAKATSSPAVISTSSKSNTTGLRTRRRKSARSPYRHLSRETKRAAVHRTSISLGHGQHVFPLDLRHARPLTSVRSVPGVPLHPLLPGLVVSYLPSLTAFHLDRHMLLGYALCW